MNIVARTALNCEHSFLDIQHLSKVTNARTIAQRIPLHSELPTNNAPFLSRPSAIIGLTTE
jgi:hypothetical protein